MGESQGTIYVLLEALVVYVSFIEIIYLLYYMMGIMMQLMMVQ